MAVRSGAGIGVIVSLVIFILLTIFGLVMTIALYTGKGKAELARNEARDTLAKYVTTTEQNSEQFSTIEQKASQSGKSVVAYQLDTYNALAQYVVPGSSKSMTEIKADLANLGVEDGESVRAALQRSRVALNTRQSEVDGLNRRIQDRDDELAEKNATIERMRDDHRDELDKVTQEISAYRQAAEEYKRDVDDTVARMESAIDTLRGEYEDRIARLERDLDGERQDLVNARARLDEYQAILNEIRVKAKNPALLVDAIVLDVDPAENQIFINRGRDDRIVLGMTFEVYTSAAAIAPRGDVMPRGVASVEVTKVGPNTATCKVTRSVPGRPIVKDNVLANAVYDPDYRFKFLVHGKFDLDLDGRPTESEADHLRAMIVNWGGEVVEGDDLPGDLDFLVLGAEPPLPRPIGADASQAQINVWARQRDARQRYLSLLRQASSAQVPVLNANRFFILTGAQSN